MKPPFSERTRWPMATNALAQQLATMRAAGRTWDDLTESNPTRVGLGPAPSDLAVLGHERGARYEPQALGHPEAREAIATSYRDRGFPDVRAERVLVTASTSEAYGWLFKLLCNQGDEVLVPQPSYPLFAYLAALEDVRLVPYPLLAEERFRPDLSAIARRLTSRTRAVVIVHPNNPTGTFFGKDDVAELEALAEAHGLAIIVDEVFADYPLGALDPDKLPSFVTRDRVLTFVLNGLSKVLALPQVKLGWMILGGPNEVVDEAQERLDVIADTYLSVGTPIQRALPDLLALRERVQGALRDRLLSNLHALDAILARYDGSVRRLAVEGGWYAILEVPRTQSEDQWIATLLEQDQVLVHPGWFFDFEREGYLVLSLLPEPTVFARAAARLVARLMS